MPGRSLVRLNPLYKAVLACLVVVPFLGVTRCAASDWNHDWNYEETRSDARDFAAGGSVHLRLSVGDVHIKRGDTSRISLHYTIKSHREKNVKEANVDFDIRGTDATIEFHATSGGNTQFDVDLEVPQNTNLDVHAKVGDVTVEEVEATRI